jgi:hypothetical protein
VSFNAFYLDGLLETSGYQMRAALALVLCAVLLVTLFAASARRSYMIAGSIFYLFLCAVLVSVCLMLSSGEDLYTDIEGNYLYLALVIVFVCTAGFLLTRSLLGSAWWFLICAFVCTIVEAFYQTGEVALSVTASFTSLALIIYRNFHLGHTSADVAQRSASGSDLLTSLAAVCATGAFALFAWFVLIAPMEPDVLKVVLITDWRRLPIEERKGTAQTRPTFNYDYTTDVLIDGFLYTTDDLKEDPTALVSIDASSLLEQQLTRQLEQSAAEGTGAHETLDPESTTPVFNPVAYSVLFPVILAVIAAVLALIALIVAYFYARRYVRHKRLLQMLGETPEIQVIEIYRFVLGRLNSLGFKVPSGMTLGEWAQTSARAMDMLCAETQVAFSELTKTYEACVYGRYVPSEDEVLPFVGYYIKFWKAARTHLGNVRYFFKAFRL